MMQEKRKPGRKCWDVQGAQGAKFRNSASGCKEPSLGAGYFFADDMFMGCWYPNHCGLLCCAYGMERWMIW